jgi:hypothetical protein
MQAYYLQRFAIMKKYTLQFFRLNICMIELQSLTDNERTDHSMPDVLATCNHFCL